MDVNWDKAIEVAVTAVGSGGSAFIGAFFRFKQRLKEAEASASAAKELAQAAISATNKLESELNDLRKVVESNVKGWRLELTNFQHDYERDQRHREELEDVRRDSRPDLAETFRHELSDLKRQLDRLRDKQGTYVRNETFTEHARAQEQQWKEIQRVLGRLEALAEQ